MRSTDRWATQIRRLRGRWRSSRDLKTGKGRSKRKSVLSRFRISSKEKRSALKAPKWKRKRN